MTLTIDLTPEQETRLLAEAARNGLSVQDYILHGALSDTASDVAPTDALPGASLADFLNGYVGVFAGKPREDGRSWSLVEAACDDDAH